jgi:hypothetical protein
VTPLDRAWCEAVVGHLQPVFDEDGSDWSFTGIPDPPSALLWEASPTAFVARHPDAGIEASYNEPATAIPCLDFWVYLDRANDGHVQLSWEGWTFPWDPIPVTGNGDRDGRMLAALLRAHLRLPPG